MVRAACKLLPFLLARREDSTAAWTGCGPTKKRAGTSSLVRKPEGHILHSTAARAVCADIPLFISCVHCPQLVKGHSRLRAGAGGMPVRIRQPMQRCAVSGARVKHRAGLVDGFPAIWETLRTRRKPRRIARGRRRRHQSGLSYGGATAAPALRPSGFPRGNREEGLSCHRQSVMASLCAAARARLFPARSTGARQRRGKARVASAPARAGLPVRLIDRRAMPPGLSRWGQGGVRPTARS